MVGVTRIERAASASRMQRSTPELHPVKPFILTDCVVKFKPARPCSSIGQSRPVLRVRLQVRFLPGAPLLYEILISSLTSSYALNYSLDNETACLWNKTAGLHIDRASHRNRNYINSDFSWPGFIQTRPDAST